MKPLAASILSVILVLFSLSPSWGETFTLQDVYRHATEQNERIGISRRDIRIAEYQKRRAIARIHPSLTATGRYDRFPEETGSFGENEQVIQPRESYGVDLRLEQPVFSGGKARASIESAKKGIASAEAGFRSAAEQLLSEVAEAHYGVLRAQRSLDAERQNVERLTEHRRLSDLRFKAGEVTEASVLRAQAELARAEAEFVTRENNLTVDRRRLQSLAGLPFDFELSDPALPERPMGDLDQLLREAIERREDLKQVRFSEEIAFQDLAFTRGDFLPRLWLEASYFWRGQEPESSFFIGQSWVVGARIEFPIFEGGLRVAERSQARIRLEQARLSIEELKKQVWVEVAQSYLGLEAATRVLKSRQDQVRFADRNFQIVSKQFTFGIATNVDLLDANQTLVEAERDLIAATYDQHLAIIDLQRSVGVYLNEAAPSLLSG